MRMSMRHAWRHAPRRLVMKSVAEFDVNLTRIVEVESSEGEAVVEQDAAIRHIQSGQRDFVLLAETLPDGNVERGVLRQIVPRILRVRHPVRESRAVVDIRRSERVRGKTCIKS